MAVGRRPTRSDIDNRAFALWQTWATLCGASDAFTTDIGKYTDAQIMASLGYSAAEAAQLRTGVTAMKALCDLGRGVNVAGNTAAAQTADASVNPFGGV